MTSTRSNSPTPITLLAPARDKATALEALRHGADAVYMGAERFGARKAAGNSVADIEAVAREAHLYGAEVYATVNTILFDDELEAAERLAWDLYRAGVDALIVQDMAFMKMNLPPIPLHASTQMDNRTAEKVRWLRNLGFEQVVLARELTLEETASIHAAVPDVRLEAFVHGSICVSLNGQCYASQYCFRRSANRGECAQFCRLPFDLVDGEGHVLAEQRHLLSLHDMNRSGELEEMLDAGVVCLKIEGRLKETSYVKNVVAYYSQRLDELVARRPADYCRASLGRSVPTFTPALAKSFNRGFTSYFLHGRTPHLVEAATPKSIGERVGTVKAVGRDSVVVAGVAAFAAGDGLCYITDEGRLEGFRVNRVEGNRLFLFDDRTHTPGLRKGLTVYRNFDQTFERTLARTSAERRIGVRWRLEETDEGFALTLTSEDGRTQTQVFPYPHEEARTPQREAIERQLARLGDTPFRCDGVEIATSREWFIPQSVLGEWRRHMGGSLPGLSPRENVSGGVAALEGCPPYLTYQANVSNRLARAFYQEQGATTIEPAFELREPDHPTLMTTRYCLRYELGLCTRRHMGGSLPRLSPRENVSGNGSALEGCPPCPSSLALRLRDGRTFPLAFDCKHCLMHVLGCLLCLFLFTSCYYGGERTEAWEITQEARDSLSWRASHHYGEGYNFGVWSDSIVLEREVPSVAVGLVDSPDVVVVYAGDPLVVADIYIDTTDVVDSVWVKVARDQDTQGWAHESELLPHVVPDDPISESIMVFSGGHLKWTLAIIVAALVAFVVLRKRRRTHTPFSLRLCSPYPTILCLLMGGAAVLYASIQLFAPDTWAAYYYNPTLNPFALRPVLGAFVGSVWLMMVFLIAVVDDVLRQKEWSDATLYLLSLFALMGAEYVLFSVSTLFYVGYPLYLIYIVWAVRRYFRSISPRYRCGECGLPMHDLGRCPRCKHMNT